MTVTADHHQINFLFVGDVEQPLDGKGSGENPWVYPNAGRHRSCCLGLEITLMVGSVF